MERSSSDVSKFLSYVLRHKPESIGISLDAQGWVGIDSLIEKSAVAGVILNRTDLMRLIAESDKRRFSVSQNGELVRASQGHSIAVNLDLVETQPPLKLFHGTAVRFIKSILENGLNPGSRNHVHLTEDIGTASNVGSRYGAPVVISVDAQAMAVARHKFYLSENGVWLTNAVPRNFLRIYQRSTEAETTSRQPIPSR